MALRKYSVRIAGHPTSISLEPEFWDAFARIAAAEGVTPATLVTRIDAGDRDGGLSSAIRLFVLKELEGRQNDRP